VASVHVLNRTAAASLSLPGNGQVNVPGTVVVDSNSPSAISVSGNAQVTAGSIQVVGGVSSSGTAHLSPNPITGAAYVADPLAGLAVPSVGGSSLGAVSVSGSASRTINPGIYSQISVSGYGKLTLNPGIYVIAGGGFTATDNASVLTGTVPSNVTGSGVLIYNAGSNYPGTGGNFGGITLGGYAQVSLTAPTTGAYAGIVLFQARDNTRAISLSGNAITGLNGGIVYAPSALLTTSGNGQLNRCPLIVSQLQITGNGINTLTVDGSQTGIDVAGQLLAGDLQVYVDNSSGKFTPDELARIDDAVAAVDATLAPYSVNVSEVNDARLANVVVGIDATTAAGGYADGVLGAESPGGITLVEGWHWYAGSDRSAIGSDQYDFETIFMHEVGHSLGLGHSADPNSVMYATLQPGQAKRALAVADLAIPDVATGPCALHAAAAPPISRAGLLAGQGAGLAAGVGLAPAWSALVLDASSAAGPVPARVVGSLRPEMPAHGGGDVLIGGASEDVLVGGEGRNLLVGGYAASGRDAARQDVSLTPAASKGRHATLDAIMARDWATTDGPGARWDPARDPGALTAGSTDDYFWLIGDDTDGADGQ
jgi:hypothetical protein